MEPTVMRMAETRDMVAGYSSFSLLRASQARINQTGTSAVRVSDVELSLSDCRNKRAFRDSPHLLGLVKALGLGLGFDCSLVSFFFGLADALPDNFEVPLIEEGSAVLVNEKRLADRPCCLGRSGGAGLVKENMLAARSGCLGRSSVELPAKGKRLEDRSR